MATSEEEDPVVQEVDVYLSKQLADNLYLFQYPVRPAHMTYDNIPHLAARIKPNQQKVELDLGIDTQSANYAKSKGEQIALNVDGQSGSGDQGSNLYIGDRMDKQTLTSVSSGFDTNRFVIGCMRDGELHISPLKGLVQLRPGFGYLDRVDSKHQTTGMPGNEDSQDEDEEAKPVTVRFARRAGDKERNTSSYSYVNSKREEEPWVHMRHHQVTDAASENERFAFLAQQTNEVNEFQVAPKFYLEKLVSKVEEETAKKPPMPNNVLSMTELKTMTLADQIKALMVNAKAMRFSQLMTLLTKGTDPTSALRCLQQVALMVQGCWVVKSDVLYPKDSHSAHSGVPAEILCRARDYVMWRFTQSRFVIRKDISTVVKVQAEEVKEILEQMARLKINKGWEFLFEYDTEFVSRHPEAVQRQQMLWDAKFQQLSKTLKISKADMDRKAKSDELAAAASPEKPKRRRTISRSRTKSGSGMSDLSDSDAEAPKERSRRQSGANRSRRNSGRGELPTKADIPPPEALSTQDAVFNGGQSVTVKSEHSNRERSDELKIEVKKFVREQLLTLNVIPLADLKTRFSIKLTALPPGHILGSGVSDKLLECSLLEEGAIAWPGVPGLYVLHTANDGYDNIRQVMLNMLKEKMILQSAKFKKNLEDTLGELPPETVWRKIMKDYCVSAGGSWVLKGSRDMKP